MIVQWADVQTIECSNATTVCLRTGVEVLASKSFDAAYLWRDCTMLLLLTILWHTIGYGGLLIRVNRAR
jgi:hypothetical protein